MNEKKKRNEKKSLQDYNRQTIGIEWTSIAASIIKAGKKIPLKIKILPKLFFVLHRKHQASL